MVKNLAQEEFLQHLLASTPLAPEEIAQALKSLPQSSRDGSALAEYFQKAGKLTLFQADAVREGRFEELAIGNYHVLDSLGAGAMGTVYKARHRRMKRVVAIKVLSRSVGQSEKFVKRFQREVEAVARLNHPNIVMAHDADEAEVGHFLVMEFVNGRDLASEVNERGPLPIAEAVSCITQAGRALNYAHGQGIIHRDIKPANLLRDSDGVVKVADLGLARFSDALGQTTEEMAALTQAGTIMGTVDFMPPEQALGLTNIDHRADIYSLGCTLYYLLIGSPPYPGTSLMSILLKHRDAPLPSLCRTRQEIPARLEAIFHRMVAKKPEERFSSMAEVVESLEALSFGPPHPRSGGEVLAIGPPSQPAASPAMSMASQTVDLPAACTVPAARTALLVEPSRSQAVIIRNYLQGLGFHTISTLSSGQQGLEAARTALPSVVLSAMHLNDMTGLELARRIRAQKELATVGFVLISSAADARELHSLSQADPVISLTKPFSAEQLSEALKAAIRNSPPEAPQAEQPLRILVVDDSATARRHIRGVLAQAGLHQIVEAEDGGKAVALLSKETFDLVVTDYNMPHLDGRGLIDFIRNYSSTPSVPIILVTTETDPAKLEAVRQLGVAAICEKSFPLEVIRHILQSSGEGHV